jgi:ubiquitin-protein ligase
MAEHEVNPSKSATRRLMRDLKELQQDPLPHASLSPVREEDMFELHANVIIPSGPYRGLVVHFILFLDEFFPASSPVGKMAPGFPFDHSHHEHIVGTGICNDYLRNFEGFFQSIDGGEKKAASGWSPGITLKSLLLVMAQFFAETDYPPPAAEHVARAFVQVAQYKCPGCGHTTQNPFPPFPNPTTEASPDSLQISRPRELLVCSTSKENYVDDPQMTLGYPIHLRLDPRNRMWTTLIPELLSYDQYVLQIQQKGTDKLDRFNDVKLRTANGQYFTHWLPVYINEDHFQKNLQCIRNTISVLSHGIQGTPANDFRPEMILRVLPCLMNKMIVAMMNGDLFESEAAIYAYCHYLGLFLRLLKNDSSLRTVIDFQIQSFLESRYNRHKKQVPDIGEFIILLSVSQKYSFYSENVQQLVLTEYFARQVFWIQKKSPLGYKLFLQEPNRRIAESFRHSEVSLKLLVFDLMAAKFFIFDGVLEKLGANFGLPPVSVVEAFQKMIRQIKSISNYKTFVEAIEFQHVITTPGRLFSFLDLAVHVSDAQGYTVQGGKERLKI